MSFHLYTIDELYSNADGSIQFIEMTVGNYAGQGYWAGHFIRASQGSTSHSFTFPTDLASEATANTRVLIATQGFANLGIVSPDFIIPAGFLFTDGGTVNFAGVDSFSYASLPTDGSSSLGRSGSKASASPTDFAGTTGTLPPSSGGNPLIQNGGAGSDTLQGTSGNDTLNGGGGIDTVDYSGSRANYTVTKTATGYTIKDNSGTDGTDTLNSIERLVFSDATIALTMDGVNAGSTSSAAYNMLAEKIYVAYFGRPADPSGYQNLTAQLSAALAPTTMQAFINSYNSNGTVKTIIDGFGTSAESGRLYTGTNADFVTAIFQNLFGRNPAGTFWIDALDNNEMSRSQAAMNIMAGAEVNTTSQGLIDAAAIANKIVVAANFSTAIVTASAYSGSTAGASARTMLHAVNQDTNVFDYQASVNTTLSAMGAGSSSSSGMGAGTYYVGFPHQSGQEPEPSIVLVGAGNDWVMP